MFVDYQHSLSSKKEVPVLRRGFIYSLIVVSFGLGNTIYLNDAIDRIVSLSFL